MNLASTLRGFFSMPTPDRDEIDDMRDKLSYLRNEVERERMWREIDKLRCQLRAT